MRPLGPAFIKHAESLCCGWPPPLAQVEALARSVLQDPLRVTVGERNTAAATVKQRLLFVGRESGKLLALRQVGGGRRGRHGWALAGGSVQLGDVTN